MSPAVEQPLDFEHRVQKLREIYADATEILRTALENVIRSVQSGAPGTELAPMESAGRIPPPFGKGFGADDAPPHQAERGEADARVPGASARQPRQSGRGQGRHRPRHALRLPRQRHEAALLHRLRRRLGSLHRRLRDQDPRHPGPSVRRGRRLAVGIRSPKIKDFIVKHQIPAYFWYVANPNSTVVETRGDLREDWQGGRRIPRQGGLTNKSDDDGGAHWTPLAERRPSGPGGACGVFVTR